MAAPVSFSRSLGPTALASQGPSRNRRPAAKHLSRNVPGKWRSRPETGFAVRGLLPVHPLVPAQFGEAAALLRGQVHVDARLESFRLAAQVVVERPALADDPCAEVLVVEVGGDANRSRELR